MEFAGLTYGELLRFLVGEARARNRTPVPSITEIQQLLLDTAQNESRARTSLCSASTVFLRRHRSPRHDQLYVERVLDHEIRELLVPLTPGKLKDRFRTTQHGDISVEHVRARPLQLAIIRDTSGAGKTTLSVNLAGGIGHLGISRAALEADVDNIIDLFLKIGRDYGLSTLSVINKPIVYVLDSLDEALLQPQKSTELRSLFKSIEFLNQEANKRGFLCYPILILLTVRDEYWRDWESQLEGRSSRVFINKFSRFNKDDLQKAIKKYEEAYNYKIENMNSDLFDALSHPFTLQVYSEANEYAGAVDAKEHFGSIVLALFFNRKKEDILKRPIAGFDGGAMIKISTAVAVAMVNLRSNELSEEATRQIISDTDPIFGPRSDAIIRVLKSEQIFLPESLSGNKIRFRHSRFLEYLVAIELRDAFELGKVVFDCDEMNNSESEKIFHNMRRKTVSSRQEKVKKNGGSRQGDRAYSRLGRTIGEIYTLINATKFASPYVIFDYLKAITASDRVLAQKVAAALANSARYMDAFLIQKRSELGRGGSLQAEEVRAIKVGMVDRNPDICWNGFFVLAAVSSSQPYEVVRQAFEIAWDANVGREDLYKIILKLRRHGMLFDEEFLRRLCKSEDCQCWLTFLDELDDKLVKEFPGVWAHIGGGALQEEITARKTSEWDHVLKLLGYVCRGVPYPLGGI